MTTPTSNTYWNELQNRSSVPGFRYFSGIEAGEAVTKKRIDVHCGKAPHLIWPLTRSRFWRKSKRPRQKRQSGDLGRIKQSSYWVWQPYAGGKRYRPRSGGARLTICQLFSETGYEKHIPSSNVICWSSRPVPRCHSGWA